MPSRKSKDEVYRERNLLAIASAVLVWANGGEAGWHMDSTGCDGWPIVWFQLPTGGDPPFKQLGHHVRPSSRALLEQSPLPETRPPGGYDGHTRKDRLNRMVSYIGLDS